MKNAGWLFGFAVLLLAIFLPSYAKMQDLRMKNNELAQRISVLQKRNVQLEQERHLLETDPMYLEKVGRDKMGLIRPGEKIYRIVPAKTGAATKAPAQQ